MGVRNKNDTKTSRVLWGSSNVPTIQNTIENMIKISRARLKPSRSKLIIHYGKLIQQKVEWIPMDIIETTLPNIIQLA